MRYALVDESGRLADRKDEIIVFVALIIKSLINLDKIIPQIKKRLPLKGKRRKEKRKIVDSPINYALLVATLLGPAIRKFPELTHIIIDRHFTHVFQREQFNDLVQKNLRKKLFIEHLDSQQNTIVSLPDFIAGSLRVAYTKDDLKYRKIIEKLIAEERKDSWKKIAQQKR